MIAKEGVPYLFATAAIAALCYALWGWLVSTLPITGFLFVLYFFRDPERRSPVEPDIVVAPADGKIIKIDKIQEPDFLMTKTLRISIFMSPFNVHVNRAPYTGRVLKVEHRKGGFRAAYTDLASLENENVSMLLETDRGPVLVRQIAGLVARRIVCRVKPGERLERGERYGIIKLGSRVDIFLPEGSEPLVKVGDKVKAGETAIAKLKEGKL